LHRQEGAKRVLKLNIDISGVDKINVGGIRFDWSIEMEEKVTKRHQKVGKNNKKSWLVEEKM